jgi:5-methyltetrahydropteroyltriglutamate--homocysteine methyltransferase
MSRCADLPQPAVRFRLHRRGNALTEAQQWDKVRLVTGIAAQVW